MASPRPGISFADYIASQQSSIFDTIATIPTTTGTLTTTATRQSESQIRTHQSPITLFNFNILIDLIASIESASIIEYETDKFDRAEVEQVQMTGAGRYNLSIRLLANTQLEGPWSKRIAIPVSLSAYTDFAKLRLSSTDEVELILY